MKKKSLLVVIAILSVLLVGVGTSYAVLGVNDAVPGENIVVPIICEKGGSFNTNWAIAEKDAGAPVDASGHVVKGHLFVSDQNSKVVFDEPVTWTANDVLVDNCQALVTRMGATAINIETTVAAGPVHPSPTKTFYVAYVEYRQETSNEVSPRADRFISWVYLVDITKGFSAGFNGISSEFGVGQELGEDADLAPVTAHSLYPRFILSPEGATADPDSWTWWIILAGRNEIAAYDAATNVHRSLQCNFCDEDENCPSNGIPLPKELSIINVADFAPGSIVGKNGFAECDITEVGTAGTINGTRDPKINATDAVSLKSLPSANGYYSIFGWSYQRVVAGGGLPNVAAANEIHRTYCDLCQCARPVGSCFHNPGTPCTTDSQCIAGDTCIVNTSPVCNASGCVTPLTNDTSLGLNIFLNYVTGDTTDVCTSSF